MDTVESKKEFLYTEEFSQFCIDEFSKKFNRAKERCFIYNFVFCSFIIYAILIHFFLKIDVNLLHILVFFILSFSMLKVLWLGDIENKKNILTSLIYLKFSIFLIFLVCAIYFDSYWFLIGQLFFYSWVEEIEGNLQKEYEEDLIGKYFKNCSFLKKIELQDLSETDRCVLACSEFKFLSASKGIEPQFVFEYNDRLCFFKIISSYTISIAIKDSEMVKKYSAYSVEFKKKNVSHLDENIKKFERLIYPVKFQHIIDLGISRFEIEVFDDIVYLTIQKQKSMPSINSPYKSVEKYNTDVILKYFDMFKIVDIIVGEQKTIDE